MKEDTLIKVNVLSFINYLHNLHGHTLMMLHKSSTFRFGTIKQRHSETDRSYETNGFNRHLQNILS